MQGFSHQQTVFYAVCFISGAVACLFRAWNDRESNHTIGSVIGRAGTSGVYGFGVVAILLDVVPGSAGSSVGAYGCVAISAFVGMAGREIQEKLIGIVFRKIGLIKDEKN